MGSKKIKSNIKGDVMGGKIMAIIKDCLQNQNNSSKKTPTKKKL